MSSHLRKPGMVAPMSVEILLPEEFSSFAYVQFKLETDTQPRSGRDYLGRLLQSMSLARKFRNMRNAILAGGRLKGWMKRDMDENEVRIRLHCPWRDDGYFVIEVKRKWLIFSRWERVCQFLDKTCGEWNPVLLQYQQAKQLAIRVKSQAYLDEFIRKENAKFKAYMESKPSTEVKSERVEQENF